MATYTLIPNAGQTFHVAIVSNDGARQTLLGFETKADAEAWIAQDRIQNTTDDPRMLGNLRRFCQRSCQHV
jgi:hypothetical protein